MPAVNARPFWDPAFEQACSPRTPSLLFNDWQASTTTPSLTPLSLTKVAQSVGTEDNELPRQETIRGPDAGFKSCMELALDSAANECSLRETIESANSPGCIDEVFESEIHQQLADLNLPLYVTTNFDSFQTLALKAEEARAARRARVDWQGKVKPRKPATGSYDLKPRPSQEGAPRPMHLFGPPTTVRSGWY